MLGSFQLSWAVSQSWMFLCSLPCPSIHNVCMHAHGSLCAILTLCYVVSMVSWCMHAHGRFCAILILYCGAICRTWAARYHTGLLIKLMPKGVVFSFLCLQPTLSITSACACIIMVDSVQPWFCIVVQYGELVYACWYGRQVFTAIMVAITIAACLRTTLRTYANRRMLIRCSVPLAQPCVELNCVHSLACLGRWTAHACVQQHGRICHMTAAALRQLV